MYQFKISVLHSRFFGAQFALKVIDISEKENLCGLQSAT